MMQCRRLMLLWVMLVFCLGYQDGRAQVVLIEDALRADEIPTGWSATNVTFSIASSGYARLDSTGSVLITPVFDGSSHGFIRVAFAVAKFGAGIDGPITVETRTDSASAWVKSGNSPTPESSDYLAASFDIYTVSSTMQIRFSRPDSPSQKRMRDVQISGIGIAGTPSFQSSLLSLSGFGYVADAGPSSVQSYTFSGFNLQDEGVVNVDVPSAFQISDAENGVFGASLDLPHAEGSITGQQPVTLYVRMAAGLTPGSYSGDITHAGGGVATSLVVTVEGAVSLPIPGTMPATAIERFRFTANWTPVSGAMGYEIDVATAETFAFGGSESFEHHTASGTYGDGSFTGDNGVTWHFVASRNDAGYNIDGAGILMRYSNENSRVYSDPVPGGIGSFSCRLKKGFTSAGERRVELFVNGISQGVSEAFDDSTIRTFTVEDIDIEGAVEVRISNITANQVVIDDIYWTAYPSPVLQEYAGKAVTGSSALVLGLKRGTTYYYRIRATAGDMIGAWSAVRDVTTLTEDPPFIFMVR